MNIRVLFALCYRSSFFLRLLLLLLFLLGTKQAFAQQMSQPDREFVAPKRKSQPVQKRVQKESPVTPDGILTKAYQSKRPWEMVSPVAPDSYGTGEEMISENPDELGKQNGLIIFGIEW